jgi:colanic acid/amylovoran biosynthesis glycosyltransferase
MQNSRLLLVLPLPVYCSESEMKLDRQAVNGLHRWLDSFSHVTVCMPVRSFSEAPPEAVVFTESEFSGRCTVVKLPNTYLPHNFLMALPSTVRLLDRLIDESRYLSFAIGGLFGDWGAVAALRASRKNRRASVWADRVEHRVASFTASQSKGVRRYYLYLTAWLMKYYERHVIKKSSIGLFHGADCFEYYAKYSPSPHLVHNIHVKKEDHISQKDLVDKLARVGDREKLSIIYIGRVHADKGVLDWILTLERLRNVGVDFQATWYGAGPLLDEARDKVREMRLDDYVAFPGSLNDRRKLFQLLRDADLFLFCHRTPESPRCLIESLISGTPIVGYDSMFPRDLIKENNGGVLTAHSPESLSLAIADLSRDKATFAKLVLAAANDGKPFNDEEVFNHRSDIIKQYS